MESKANFRARVRALTNTKYSRIPLAPAGEVISSIILARRGQVYIVAAPSRAADETSAAAAEAVMGEFGGEFIFVLRRCDASCIENPWPGDNPEDSRWCCAQCAESVIEGRGLTPGHFQCQSPARWELARYRADFMAHTVDDGPDV